MVEIQCAHHAHHKSMHTKYTHTAMDFLSFCDVFPPADLFKKNGKIHPVKIQKNEYRSVWPIFQPKQTKIWSMNPREILFVEMATRTEAGSDASVAKTVVASMAMAKRAVRETGVPGH
jgi:hypothetical protein